MLHEAPAEEVVDVAEPGRVGAVREQEEPRGLDSAGREDDQSRRQPETRAPEATRP